MINGHKTRIAINSTNPVMPARQLCLCIQRSSASLKGLSFLVGDPIGSLLRVVSFLSEKLRVGGVGVDKSGYRCEDCWDEWRRRVFPTCMEVMRRWW